MTSGPRPSPWGILTVVGLGTGLSLFGDSALYAVLPTHTTAAGISVASVGILLSVNRLIRVVLNGPMGIAYAKWSHRRLFVAALFIGAASTATYGLTRGFWPLLAGRLLWGLAWAGIWVGGNTIVLALAGAETRGRWVGTYQFSFFLGAASGAFTGGWLTDWLGYHVMMLVAAGLTLLSAGVALLFLPETRSAAVQPSEDFAESRLHMPLSSHHFVSATLLYAINRLVIAGLLNSTLGLLLLDQVGEQMQLAGREIGVATLTGSALGTATLIAMLSAPLAGGLSDRSGNRWAVAAVGLVPGVAGFGLLAWGLPVAILSGVALTSLASGSNQSLATALVGDSSAIEHHSRHLGWLFTAGDLASAIGPLLAYAMIPLVGIRAVYLLGGTLFALTLLLMLHRTRAT